MRRTWIPAAAILSLAMLLASCGSSSKSSAPPPGTSRDQTSAPSVTTAPAPSAGGTAIVIEASGTQFKFRTSPVKAGETVTVKNNTSVQHTVSANTAAGGFDVTIDPGKTATFPAPAKPGAYPFHCNIHTYMMGTLTVT
jgi:plastocyanin